MKMGEYFILACLKCKEYIYLGKLTEPDKEKFEEIWWFFNNHLGSNKCNLRLVGDEHNSDGEVIKHDEKCGFSINSKLVEMKKR